jgi:hypothetical protein
VDLQPSTPTGWHVWVTGNGGYVAPTPGVVVQWQYLPVHNATASGWAALVVHVPFEGAVAMEWVPAERVEPIVDPAPQER